MIDVFRLIIPGKSYIYWQLSDYSILSSWLISSHGMNVQMLWGIGVGFVPIPSNKSQNSSIIDNNADNQDNDDVTA